MTLRTSRLACALAVGGSDPGGGAGIAADLRAFEAAGAFGCAAIAAITVQSTAGLRSVRALPAREVVAQLREVLRVQRVRAVKVGALGSADNARAVGAWLASHPRLPVVVDPVMLPTRGRARLLARDALEALRASLASRATLVTANALEASRLLGKTRAIAHPDEARAAAIAICANGARAALVKGGHLEGAEAVDFLALASRGARIVELRAPRLRLPPIHGGGCVLASLIAGRLARDFARFEADPDEALLAAVRWAKRVHHRLLARAVDVGGPMRVLVP